MRARVVVPVVLLLVAAGAAVGFLLAGMGGDEVPAAAPSESEAPPEPQVLPLTGVEAEEVPDRAVLAVKVENSAAARPQAGLEAADVVFEELTEGGITRFIGLFHATLPETVGPVRSARFVDADVLPAYDPVLAISGAADPVDRALADAGLTVVQESEGFFRSQDRAAPHNLYLSPEDVLAAVDGPPPPAEPVWPYAATPPSGGAPGGDLLVAMSDVAVTGWTYDAEAGVYRREQDGVPFTVTGPDRIGAANVVVVGVETEQIPGQDSSGQPLLGSDVTGTGRAIVLRDGQRFEAEWSKPSAGQHFAFSGADGAPLAFKPGPTWLLLAPSERLPAPVAPSTEAPTPAG